ncbi:hypothetical protein F4780DRAFT_775577 [Xylariomycetidae sp. FL0641]|nr:hypothetical protein F4780DRAFT_775577 [Xylariomycetidae sp. FL0641]
MIEKNSHFNFLWHFPRFSVVEGHEHLAFLPYDSMLRDLPPGSCELVRGTVENLTDTQVRLASGETIEFVYLALATGCSRPPPVRPNAADRNDACAEFRAVQDRIKTAQDIAVIGAGAVKGTMQIASDGDGCDSSHVFALGDVAEHDGPHMARAAEFQAEIVVSNILAMIQGYRPTSIYRPKWFVEGFIKLTLGKDRVALYTSMAGSQGDMGESDILLDFKHGAEDLDIERAWRLYGADFSNMLRGLNLGN